MPISHLLTDSLYQPRDAEVDNITNLTNGLELDHEAINRADTLNASKSPHEKFVLIDTDAGTEDAWALFMALAAHRSNSGIKIVGITTVYGTTSVDNVVNNVTRTLNTVKQNDIPVYKGMDSSLVGKFRNTQSYHGRDGFGDANLASVLSRTEPGHAVQAIINLAETYAGKLTIVCLGPLTNLAMAVKLRPDLKTLVKEVFILGGNMEGLGNTTVGSEFNFYVDPEAAQVVLDNFGGSSPVYILPWETCVKFGAVSHSWRTNILGKMRTPEISLLNRIEEKILKQYTDSWLVSDAILIACLICPKVVKSAQTYHCTVELAGKHTRGMMLVDKSFLQQKQSNAVLITEVDQHRYESMLIWAAGGPNPRKNSK